MNFDTFDTEISCEECYDDFGLSKYLYEQGLEDGTRRARRKKERFTKQAHKGAGRKRISRQEKEDFS